MCAVGVIPAQPECISALAGRQGCLRACSTELPDSATDSHSIV
ncbi:replication protein RepA4 [Salmonella enterica subsp. enterica serovar Javiana]|nr:replication protein RepA4 [Salmonella enterica subsp. enterica serovar Javiana]EBV2938535.1 replication protein RepA4 [Salmonella enterica subsp. enterica serovar Javiana]